MGGDFGSAYASRIFFETFLPLGAEVCKGGADFELRWVALIFLPVAVADGHFDADFGNGFLGFLVYISADCGPH
jgi:hypothetical protein